MLHIKPVNATPYQRPVIEQTCILAATVKISRYTRAKRGTSTLITAGNRSKPNISQSVNIAVQSCTVERSIASIKPPSHSMRGIVEGRISEKGT